MSDTRKEKILAQLGAIRDLINDALGKKSDDIDVESLLDV